MTRNINDYADQYKKVPFEPIQLRYRRKMVLQQIAKVRPKHILEIGCGDLPLFPDLPDDLAFTIIEPSEQFVRIAQDKAKNRQNISIHNMYAEDYRHEGTPFEMIILSSVLHEVSDPQTLLRAIHHFCEPHTVLHVNVPNALSFHRLLGMAMGLVKAPDETSATQQRLQQNGVTYDTALLESELDNAGFSVIEKGDFFIKPFTHAQMQTLIDTGFMTQEMLDGLDKLAQFMHSGYGSEIWMNVKRK